MLNSKTTTLKPSIGKTMRMKKSRGFTLLEVMIASFVLSVGMLGSTAMMLRGLQQADNTNYEGVAAQTAMNMAERMRGNIQGQGKDGSVYDNLVADRNATANCAVLCNSAEVALYHAYIWGLELDDLMPNANATGAVVALNPGVDDSVYQITVEWDSDKRVDTTSRTNTRNTYVMIFQP